jgi:hypothetical protein
LSEKFSLDEIEEKINSVYELDSLILHTLAEDDDPSIYDEQVGQLRVYFERLADWLWKAGAFKSQKEARSVVRPDVDSLQHIGGPCGVRPDDGLLNPDEIAQGILALKKLNEFVFQAPLCVMWTREEIEYMIDAGGVKIRITSNYDDLTLVKRHPRLGANKQSERYIWIESVISAHRYDFVRAQIDQWLVSIMGMMEIFGLVQYKSWSYGYCEVSIGAGDRFNSGAYLDMRSIQLARHLHGLNEPTVENDIDRARTKRERIDVNLRTLCRALGDSSPAGLAVRQACRMYLRAYDTWNMGESAMFLAATLEGLLLDRRQKDDLSARLQDSVAYWLGGPSSERERNRKCIADLYKARSGFVHNGTDAPADFNLSLVRELTKQVIKKELVTLRVQS